MFLYSTEIFLFVELFTHSGRFTVTNYDYVEVYADRRSEGYKQLSDQVRFEVIVMINHIVNFYYSCLIFESDICLSVKSDRISHNI